MKDMHIYRAYSPLSISITMDDGRPYKRISFVGHNNSFMTADPIIIKDLDRQVALGSITKISGDTIKPIEEPMETNEVAEEIVEKAIESPEIGEHEYPEVTSIKMAKEVLNKKYKVKFADLANAKAILGYMAEFGVVFPNLTLYP